MEEHSTTNSCAKGMTPESDEARGPAVDWENIQRAEHGELY